MRNYSQFFPYIFTVLAVFVGLLLINLLNISYPISVTTRSTSGELSVVGEGRVDVVPDVAYVDVGITVQNGTSVEFTQSTMNDVNNKIIEAMKGMGIESANIKTSNYSVYPNYRYEGGADRITGYNGNATISIKVKDPQMATKVIEGATKAGANQIQGTRFTVDDPGKYREQAREKAIANAKDQAQKLASSLGIRLGKVTNIVESTPNQNVPYPMYAAEKSMAGGGGGPQIEAGSQTVTSTVTLFFEK